MLLRDVFVDFSVNFLLLSCDESLSEVSGTAQSVTALSASPSDGAHVGKNEMGGEERGWPQLWHLVGGWSSLSLSLSLSLSVSLYVSLSL